MVTAPTATARPTSVVIIDHHAMVSQGLQIALDQQPDIEVMGAAFTLRSGLEMVEQQQPSVVLLDFDLLGADVADAVQAIRQTCAHTAVIIISPNGDYDSVARALAAGALGYLLKDQPLSELVAGVRATETGGRPLAPRLVSALVARMTRTTTPAHQLSPREIEVLRHLAEGRSTADTAALMGVSLNTIRNQVQSAIRRLGAHSKLEAVAIAQREGVISSPLRRSHEAVA
jgi:DNA-binding NarL/FixJ family response regulator